ncbi:hypothetical protein [Tessaracoccus massiliensis]|nr:hypothetical protein [Tessaracoccus massiliensis]
MLPPLTPRSGYICAIHDPTTELHTSEPLQICAVARDITRAVS